MPSSVFHYPGGKACLAPKILKMFPPPDSYKVFVDVFGGSASVLLALPDRPDLLKVYNDIDQELFNFFKVLRNPETREKLIEMLELTPYSRQQFKECVTMPLPNNPVERAWRFYVITEQQFNGASVANTNGSRWSYVINPTGHHKPRTWANKIKNLAYFGERFREVQVENLDFSEVIKRYDGPTTLFYADPPYVPFTREAHMDLYTHEMTLEQHMQLCEMLNSIQGMAVLSGYSCTEYEQWYSSWEKHKFDVTCAMSSRGSVLNQKGLSKPKRVECVWFNPAASRAREEMVQLSFEEFQNHCKNFA